MIRFYRRRLYELLADHRYIKSFERLKGRHLCRKTGELLIDPKGRRLVGSCLEP